MNKEQYLATIAAWRQYIADGKHKKKKIPCWGWSEEQRKYVDDAYFRFESDLTSMHHLLYAMIRKRPLTEGFKDNYELARLCAELKGIVNFCKEDGNNNASNMAKRLMVPFGEHFTMQMLRDAVTQTFC